MRNAGSEALPITVTASLSNATSVVSSADTTDILSVSTVTALFLYYLFLRQHPPEASLVGSEQ